jgi:ketosteroid isomerase-like protein
MKKILLVISLLLLFCLVVYCQKQAEKPTLSVNTQTELNAIREMYKAWAKALEAKDVDGTCSFFADDFVIPYGDSLRDKKWYREFLMERISEGTAWKMYLPERLEVSASGDLAYAVGYYDMARNAEAKAEKHCGLDVLKKQKDGSWKFVSFR